MPLKLTVITRAIHTYDFIRVALASLALLCRRACKAYVQDELPGKVAS